MARRGEAQRRQGEAKPHNVEEWRRSAWLRSGTERTDWLRHSLDMSCRDGEGNERKSKAAAMTCKAVARCGTVVAMRCNAWNVLAKLRTSC